MKTLHRPHAQAGVLLIEVMVALLIFALGVLGLMSLQANAIKQSSQSKFRADATLLANDLIGQIWMSNRTPAILKVNFESASNGSAYKAWKDRIVNNNLLPGAAAYPPSVVVDVIQPLPDIVAGVPVPSALPPSARVTITMYWKAPGERDEDVPQPHNIVLVNEIK